MLLVPLAALVLVAVTTIPALATRIATREMSVPAPTFSIDRLDGTAVSSSDFRGDVVVLDFWATWCPACRRELPELEKLYRRYQGNSRVRFWAVDVQKNGETPEKARDFMQKAGYTLPVAFGSEKCLEGLSREDFPSLIIIDTPGLPPTSSEELQASHQEINLRRALGAPDARSRLPPVFAQSDDLIVLHGGNFNHHGQAAQARAVHNTGGEDEHSTLRELHALNGGVRVDAVFRFQRMLGKVDFQMMRVIVSVLRALFVGEAEREGAERFVRESGGKFARFTQRIGSVARGVPPSTPSRGCSGFSTLPVALSFAINSCRQDFRGHNLHILTGVERQMLANFFQRNGQNLSHPPLTRTLDSSTIHRCPGNGSHPGGQGSSGRCSGVALCSGSRGAGL